MKTLNLVRLKVSEQRETIDTLKAQKQAYQLMVQNRDSSITLLNNAISLQSERITSAQDMLEQTNDLLTKYARKTKWLKIQRGVLGVLLTAETGILIWQLSTH